MREIKFRVWDDDHFVYMGLKGAGWSFSEPLNEASAVQWQQFTGLTDRHGKEIYEGDLVKFTGKTKRDKIRTYEVVWDDHRSRFIGKHVAYEDQWMPIRRFANEHEVVGNIYENPDLLK